MLMKGGNDFSQIVLANPTLGPLLLVTYQIIGVLIGVKLPSAIISKTFSTISGLLLLRHACELACKRWRLPGRHLLALLTLAFRPPHPPYSLSPLPIWACSDHGPDDPMAQEFRKLLARNFKMIIFKIFFWGKKTDEDLFQMERDAEHEEGRLPSIVNSTDPLTPVTPQNLLAS